MCPAGAGLDGQGEERVSAVRASLEREWLDHDTDRSQIGQTA
jgi:hypothetical protein